MEHEGFSISKEKKSNQSSYSDTRTYIADSNEHIFKASMIFESFHHQARIPL